MKDDTSVFGIFQDPLLTLVALMLIVTLPVILPRENSGSGNGTGAPVSLNELIKVKGEIDSLETKIKELEENIQRLMDEIGVLKDHDNASLQTIRQEIAKLRAIIQKQKEELDRLKAELETARKAAQEATLVEELIQKIGQLRNEIADKEALLKTLEDKLKEKLPNQTTPDIENQRETTSVEEWKVRIQTEQDLIKGLEVEKGRLEDFTIKNPNFGIPTPIPPDAKQIAYEAIDNKLFEIGDKNYDIKVFTGASGGRTVLVREYTLKTSATGESTNRIREPGSEFQKRLSAVNPKEYYIFFGVQEPSFGVFLEARRIAFQKGFAVGWFPWEPGPIDVVAGAKEGDIKVRTPGQ